MKNQVIAIIGGSSGIGFEVARQCIEHGGKVYIGGRNRQRLHHAIEQLGPAATAIEVDMTDQTALQRFFAQLPAIDHLFTPGANYGVGKFLDLDEETARSPMEHKFWGQYWAIKHAYPKIRAGGSVVLMAGALGKVVLPTGAAYAACNSAIETLGRSLAKELPTIRFNTVSPGTIDSELWRNRPGSIREPAFAQFAATALVGRVGSVEEVAQAVIFLMQNRFMTGETLTIDGGWSC